jgi:hypothetical protein
VLITIRADADKHVNRANEKPKMIYTTRVNLFDPFFKVSVSLLIAV